MAMTLRWLVLVVLAVLVSACGVENPTPLATEPARQVFSVSGVTPPPYATPTVDEVAAAWLVIERDRATSTAVSAATSTAYSIQSTQRAQATEAFWVGVTMAVSTERAQETRVAKTEIAGTQLADAATAVPLTLTPLAATQQIEAVRLKAERVSLWIWQVGGAVFGVLMLGVLGYGLYLGLRWADEFGAVKNFEKKADSLRPDPTGRRPALTTGMLKKGEKLIVPELAHRATIDPDADDLTTEQALKNAGDQRKLEVVRSLSSSPVLPRLLGRMADYYVKTAMQDVTIGQNVPQPENPLLPVDDMPALPPPHFKKLFAWDGQLLPYGVDEKEQLMLVDPTRRPHMMITGDSGSGKSRSAIRTLMSGALASGWNVVVLGKQVDFLPFEEHPNCKIVPVNVRKEPQKYAQVLRTLAEQMDVRDAMLASKGITTWDRYGAPQTMIVLDDFSGAMFAMQRSSRTEVLNEAKAIAMDGRKFGLNLVIGLQRASWTSIDTDLRSQMGRVVYRVASAVDSRVALDVEGAEKLAHLNFLSRLTDDSSIQRGVGFFLQDGEVEAFLKSRPVTQNEPVEWVDAKVEDVTVTPETSTLDEARAKADETVRIQDTYLAALSRQDEKLSLRMLERAVFGADAGGNTFHKVRNAIALYEGCSPDDVSKVIAEHVRTWKSATDSATNDAATGDLGDFSPKPA
jgi:hypothetical protein